MINLSVLDESTLVTPIVAEIFVTDSAQKKMKEILFQNRIFLIVQLEVYLEVCQEVFQRYHCCMWWRGYDWIGKQ